MKHEQPPNTPDSRHPSDVEDEQAKAQRYYGEAIEVYLDRVWDDDTADGDPASEVWLSFETAYAGSYEGADAFVETTIQELGWLTVLEQAKRIGNIPPGVLALDYRAIFNYLIRYYVVFSNPDEVLHVFKKPDIMPPASEIPTQGGARYD